MIGEGGWHVTSTLPQLSRCLQDAEKGRHADIQQLLLKHGGKAFRKLAISGSAQEEMREGDRRHAITEILFFASVGDIKRMHGLCLVHDISVSPFRAAMHLSHPSFSTESSLERSYTRRCSTSLTAQKQSPGNTCSWDLALLQVSDPSCCDYDKRTPL